MQHIKSIYFDSSECWSILEAVELKYMCGDSWLSFEKI